MTGYAPDAQYERDYRESGALTHAAFERNNPDWRDYERHLDAQRVARGMPSARSFPCPGVLQRKGFDPDTLGCSICGFHVAITPHLCDRKVEPAQGDF